MSEFTHSVIVPNEAVVAGTQRPYNLPVQPLSFLLLTLKYLQNSANLQHVIANIVALIDKVEVLYKGSSIISLNGADLLAAALFEQGFECWPMNYDGTDNEVMSFTWLIGFGRIPYSPVECFPATPSGELILQISYAAAFTNIDTVVCQVEAVTLPGAAPSRFLRMNTSVATPAATGEMKIPLPLGNTLVDLIVRGATIPAGIVATKTINSIEIEIDEAERYYSRSFFESLHNKEGMLRMAPVVWGSHKHQIDGAAYAQYMDSSAVKAENHCIANYLHLPFDVLGDGQYAVDLRGAKSAKLVIDAGDTGAIRMIPCEIVAV